jgi:hypothetical protein
MLQNGSQVSDLAHVIQLAVAPVFLLTGIGPTLGVLTNRLARIVDRARTLERLHAESARNGEPDLATQLATLQRRAKLINRAISLCTACALLICLVIATLFIGALVGVNLATLIVVLFLVGMLALVGGFITFLQEIFLATASLRIGPSPH